MKIAVTTVSPEVIQNVSLSLFSGDFRTRLSKVKKAGFDGIELLLLDPSQLDPGHIAALAQEYSVAIPAIGTGLQASLANLTLLAGDRENEKKAIARAHDIIEFASVCKTPIVTLGSFRGRLDEMSQRNRNHFITILSEIADFAGERSVSIAIEPINRYENDFMNTASEVMEVIDDISSKNIGLLLDTFHMNIEESSIEKTIESVSRYLLHVHIGDNNRLPPGQGHFPFQTMLQSLRSIGYDGWLSAELLAKPNPDFAGYTTGKYLRTLLELPQNQLV